MKSKFGRNGLFALLYFSEGAPIGFVWWAMPAYLRLEGLPIEDITLLSAVLVLPWTLKFLWSPLIDITRTSRWSYKVWIVTAQLLMAAALVPLLFLDPNTGFRMIIGCLLLHAMAASTQDAAIDALAISTVPKNERGTVNGWMQTGMLGGRAILGGGSLFFLNRVGFDGLVLILITIIAVIAGIALLVIRRTPEQTPASTLDDYASALKMASLQKVTWFGLIFALIGGVAFEAAGSVAGPYLVDSHFSSEAIGLFFALPVIVAMSSGALIGGLLSDRFGVYRVLSRSIVGIAVIVAAVGSNEVAGGQPVVSLILLSLMYLGIGFFTASSYAMFMSLTDKRLGATQFSLFMGVTNGCESWATAAMGTTIGAWGYAVGFVGAAVLSLIGLIILVYLKKNTATK